jgi:very-short-patch-repair endonuclease
MTADNIARKLNAWKDALIDLSRRNPLISLPAARSLISLSDSADDLWKLPAAGPKRLWLLSEKVLGTEENRSLKTRERAVSPAEFKTLNNLRLKARLSLNEQGVNVLFLVLGVLEWYDPRIGASLRSPLLMLPVTLEPLPGNDGFILSRFEEEPRVNPTLRFRLSQPDLAIELPPADPEEEEFTPSGYLASVAEGIAKKPNWKVVAEESLLGRFSYLNLVMYEELDQRMEEARRHPIIAAIAGDTEAAERLVAPDEPPLLDSEPPQRSYHVLPADPSQERAILSARYGQSLVIQGPPGTGKTQTITNLIATCIADGRRVLFVSEKMAALEAVYGRLQACGLADLCLEAHSHKAKKHEVLDQLRRTLDETIKTTPVRNAEMSVLATLRDDSNKSIAALHQRREPLGMSVYEARGIVASLAETPDHYFALDRLEEADADIYHAMERLSERLATFHDLFSQVETHPWRGLRAERFTQELYTQIRETVTDLLKATDSLEDNGAKLWALLGLPERDSSTLGSVDTDWLITVMERMRQLPAPPSAWLTETEETFSTLRNLALATQERFRHFQEGKTTLLTTFTSEALLLPHADLAARLNENPRRILEPAFGRDWAEVSDAAFAQSDNALDAAVTAIKQLTQSTERMASICGLSVPETLAQAKRLVQIASAAQSDPKPKSEWFGSGEIARLRARAQAVEARQIKERQESALVSAIFTENVYNLDLDLLRQRFDTEYASLSRFFKSIWYADQKLLKSVLLPGATLNGRQVADDLRRACGVRDLRTQLKNEDTELRTIFGGHYQGDQTDWSHLYGALEQVQAIFDLTAGNMPASLQTRLVTSGAGIDEIREQQGLVTRHLQTLEATLGEAQRHLQITGATAQPVSQISLREIVEEFRNVRECAADFVAARQTVQATKRQQEDSSIALLRDGLKKAEWIVVEENAITHESETLRARYAYLFEGLSTDWSAVLAALDHAEQLRRSFAETGRTIPAPVMAAVSADPNTIAEDASLVAEEIKTRRRELDRIWVELLVVFESLYLRTADGLHLLDTAPFAVQRSWAEVRLASLGQLERWLSFESVRKQCERFGLLSFCEVMVRRQPSAEQIPLIFRKAFHQRWLDNIIANAPMLNTLCAADHGREQAKFEKMDRALIQATPNRIRAIARERRELVLGTSVKTGELGSLRRILSQRRPRASVRKILSDIPNILFRLKPCLMMSPLSVSLFLDPQRIQFDIVIFDEASQIFPEFALGPLLRADQAVIAGDSKQLPPTSFFKGMQDDGSDASDDDDAVQAADAREFESILDAAKAPLAEATLTWHYRSRHESLIDFSNGKFYNRSLKTFPSSSLPSVVSFQHVPDGIYYGGTGNTRSNPIEAVRVADLVEAQVRFDPMLTVGVITMSEAQQDCIRAEIARRTVRDSTLAALLNEDRIDGFFIKNIENVQGDERDVIFLSIGYGRWADGKIRMLLGPLNRQGGERRLNVAITRAKQGLTVVSSLLPEDITDTASDGPRLLREYLSFARSATGAAIAGTDTAVPDTLVEAVAVALEARGHQVRRSVGLSDYRVDLAIIDPLNPEAFLLGIECDSENYLSGETARAREWLRGSVLKSLGWQLHRVWSSDWTQNREAVLQEIEQAIVIAKTGETPPSDLASETPSEPANESPAKTEEGLPEPPLKSNGLLPGLSYYEDTSALILPGNRETLYGETKEDTLARAEFVHKIVQTEAPAHTDIIALRLCRAAGLLKIGPRIKRIADDTIEFLIEAQRIEKRNDFLWVKGVEQVIPRIPAPGSEPRLIEHISREEIGEVAYVVLKNAIGMRIEEAVNETARTLGYERTGPAIKEQIENAISQLEYETRIHNFHGQLRPLEG